MKKNISQMIKILYVEDDENIRKVFSKFLQRKSKQLEVAVDGEDGYLKYLEFRPDLIISDINMPKLNGLEMSRKIKNLNKEIPIILTSAHSDSEYYTEAISIGINHYLSKPVNTKELLSAIELYAKNFLFEREQKKQEKILQNVINSDKNIIVAFDSNKIVFSNRSFLHFYGVNDDLEFLSKFRHIFETFCDEEGFLSQKTNKTDSDFIDTLFSAKDEKRVVRIFDKNLNDFKTFYVNINILSDTTNEDEEEIYLLNLTDITSMNNEKVEIQEKAFHDGLTNVYNRYRLEDIVDYELKQFKRYKKEFCFAILDIDLFKNFNDTYGHLIGDEILIAIARILKRNVRNTDVIARWGGEEFVVLLPNTRIGDAFWIVEKLRKNIEDFNHETAGGVTASIGLTTVHENDDENSLFKRADDALYEAKECGRNLVITKE